MSDKKFERFGKYLILDHLVDGGMAKICRARYLGEQANKVVAIKMVQPQFSNDEVFSRMFQDELNITFGMLHPNIMQVYDYGKTSGQLYTAMEYIHGANLKQYLDRLKEKKKAFPVESSCYIISQVCLGLHYAHTFTDKLTGKPFNIVHRDISPHNIMLTYDGAVKVIDFGIAKANTNSEATQAGTIKGKLSYLAPEYLDGMELDCRYDEFAVGITLWELLCSRKLFQASNDLAVLKQIQACKIVPPSEINPTVPKELDAIVMKALSKDRAHRFENLDQMNRVLVKFLYSTYPDFNPSDLREFADDLFGREISTDQNKFVEYGKIDILPYIDDMKKEESRTGRTSKKEMGLKEPAPRERVRELDLAIDKETNVDIQLEREVNVPEKTTTRKIQGNKAAGPTAKTASKGKPSSSGATAKKPDRTASRLINRKDIGKKSESSAGASLFITLLAAASFAFAYFQPELVEKHTGYNLHAMIHGTDSKRSISSVPKKQKGQVAESNNSSTIVDENSGQIVLRGIDTGMEVFVSGVKTEYVGRPIKVDLNKEVTLSVKKVGYLPFVTRVTLTKEANSSVINVPRPERSRVGLLTTSNNYTAGSKLVYEEGGELVERNLPFSDIKIPEGTYQAKVVNPILGTEKNVQFTIEENKKHFLE